jgi:hypothetical protein
MYDGTIKMVQDITEGELLMGDDSSPRKVLSLATGKDEMYDIIPAKGEKYTVNSVHILCLKPTPLGIKHIKSQNKNPYCVSHIDSNCKIKSKSFSNKEESILFLESCKINDPTFEGFVLRDSSNNRVKIKSESYLNLHRLSNNGNVAHPKNLIPLIMDSEINEILAYFPYLKTEINKWEKIIKSEWQNIDNLWYCYSDEISDKKFAKAIIGKTKFSDILFKSRKLNKEPKDFWNSEIIIKMLT